MKILILGGSGFIGKRVTALLREQGHDITQPTHNELDLSALNENKAIELLKGKYAVVNMVGIMSRNKELLEKVHHTAPAKLGELAKKCGVQRWVQLSALGADENQPIVFVGSKGRGDAALLKSGLEVAVARPSVVYGRGGEATELFIELRIFRC